MRNCILMYNLDNIGGQSLMIESNGGVNYDFKAIGENHFPEIARNKPWESITADWKILEPRIFETFAISNKPDWIVNIIDSTIEESGIHMRKTGNLGADQQTFTQAGVVATSIGSTGNKLHSSEDTYLQINKGSIQQVGLISSKIIVKTMKYYAISKTKKI